MSHPEAVSVAMLVVAVILFAAVYLGLGGTASAFGAASAAAIGFEAGVLVAVYQRGRTRS